MNIRNDMTDREMYIYFVGKILEGSTSPSFDIDVKASRLVGACRDRYGALEPYKVTETKH